MVMKVSYTQSCRESRQHGDEGKLYLQYYVEKVVNMVMKVSYTQSCRESGQHGDEGKLYPEL